MWCRDQAVYRYQHAFLFKMMTLDSANTIPVWMLVHAQHKSTDIVAAVSKDGLDQIVKVFFYLLIYLAVYTLT